MRSQNELQLRTRLLGSAQEKYMTATFERINRHHERAILYYKQVINLLQLSINKNNAQYILLANSYSWLSFVYFNLNQPDEAFNAITDTLKSLNLVTIQNDDYFRAMMLFRLIHASIGYKNITFTDVLEALENVVSMSKQLAHLNDDDYRVLSACHYEMGKAYLRQNQSLPTIQLFSKAIDAINMIPEKNAGDTELLKECQRHIENAKLILRKMTHTPNISSSDINIPDTIKNVKSSIQLIRTRMKEDSIALKYKKRHLAQLKAANKAAHPSKKQRKNIPASTTQIIIPTPIRKSAKAHKDNLFRLSIYASNLSKLNETEAATAPDKLDCLASIIASQK